MAPAGVHSSLFFYLAASGSNISIHASLVSFNWSLAALRHLPWSEDLVFADSQQLFPEDRHGSQVRLQASLQLQGKKEPLVSFNPPNEGLVQDSFQ